MADPSFEQQVCRLYAEPPSFADQGAFTAAVQGRLERSWAMRRVLIGAAGLVGGVITVVEVMGANLIQRAGAASQTADSRAHDVAADLIDRGQLIIGAHLPPVSGEVLWMVAGLAGVGVALVAARVMEAL